MKLSELKRALAAAVTAARASGKLMRLNLRAVKKINEATQHDIKLELDVRCQKRIEKILRATFPEISILGEEGLLGDQTSEYRWVVDPIDGTVNFTYGIPHACVSIALQRRAGATNYTTLVGVVYEPFSEELWTAIRGQRALLNGTPIRVSRRAKLNEAIVSMGFAKQTVTLNEMLPVFNRMVHRVRKIRIMGAAALAMTYVASGRFDAYVEAGVRLWDIAAGGLILECAGGDFCHQAVPGKEHTYRILVNNGLLHRKLAKLL